MVLDSDQRQWKEIRKSLIILLSINSKEFLKSLSFRVYVYSSILVPERSKRERERKSKRRIGRRTSNDWCKGGMTWNWLGAWWIGLWKGVSGWVLLICRQFMETCYFPSTVGDTSKLNEVPCTLCQFRVLLSIHKIHSHRLSRNFTTAWSQTAQLENYKIVSRTVPSVPYNFGTDAQYSTLVA